MKQLRQDQINKINFLDFLCDESQIDDKEYIQKLIEVVGQENVRITKELTGQFEGDTINCIRIINYDLSPFQDDDDDDEY